MNTDNVNMEYVDIIMQYLYTRAATEMKSVTPQVIWGACSVEENANSIVREYGLGQRRSFDFDEFINAASFVDENFEDLFDMKSGEYHE